LRFYLNKENNKIGQKIVALNKFLLK